MARLDIGNADIQEAADLIRVGGDAERHRRLVTGRPAPDVDNEPSIRDLNVPRRTIKISRSVDVGDGDEMCHGESVARGHLIVLLLDLYVAHLRLQLR